MLIYTFLEAFFKVSKVDQVPCSMWEQNPESPVCMSKVAMCK